MKSNLKALVLALVAILSTSSVAAGGAQAFFSELEVEGGGSATLTTATASTQVIQSEIGKTRCTEVHAEASVSNNDTLITAENIGYGGCSALLTFPVTVDVPETCHYTYTLESGSFDLVCGTEPIKVTIFEASDTEHRSAPICTYEIGSQTGMSATYTNVEHVGRMAVKVATSSAAVQAVHEGPLCGTGEETTHITGSLVTYGEAGEEVINITIQ